MNPEIKKTFTVLNKMVADGAIENYAVGGAIAAVFYVEAFSTEDLDVFVPAPQDRLIIELPGLDYLKARGYTTFEKEGIVVEGWPVQFLPATTPLEHEAYLNAQMIDFNEIGVRVVLPEHLVAIMLSVGREKDIARLRMFLSQEAVNLAALKDVINRHGLSTKWADYKRNS